MWLSSLQFADLRCFERGALDLSAGLNVFLGPNGAGKTSILEAAHLLSYGRSFRAGSRDAISRRGSGGVVVFSEIVDTQGRTQRLGLQRKAGRYLGRIDGLAVERLSDLFSVCAVCAFEPGSHELIAGAAEGRRRFLDWSLFHVEQDFIGTWRRYQRALKQRGAGLRAGSTAQALAPWDRELELHGIRLDRWRRQHLKALESEANRLAQRFDPELGALQLEFHPGWDADAPVGLATQLHHSHARDLLRQSTTIGPHRFDWQPSFERAPRREHLSRGQEKITALALVMAQAQVFTQARGETPIICIDDLPSELDYQHQETILEQLTGHQAQILITGTELSPPLRDRRPNIELFHVEQALIRPQARAHASAATMAHLPPALAEPTNDAPDRT